MSILQRVGVSSRPPRGAFHPITSIPWYVAFWADDTANGFTNGGSVTTFKNSKNPGTMDAVSGTGLTFASSVATLNSKGAVVGSTSGSSALCTYSATLEQTISAVWVGTIGAAGKYAFDGLVTGNRIGLYWASGGTTLNAYNGANVPITTTAMDANGHAVRAFYNFGGAYLGVGGSGGSIDGTTASGNSGGSHTATGVTLLNNFSKAQGDSGNRCAFLGIFPGDITAYPEWDRLKTWVLSYYGKSLS